VFNTPLPDRSPQREWAHEGGWVDGRLGWLGGGGCGGSGGHFACILALPLLGAGGCGSGGRNDDDDGHGTGTYTPSPPELSSTTFKTRSWIKLGHVADKTAQVELTWGRVSRPCHGTCCC
jgi:hypothetical protein